MILYFMIAVYAIAMTVANLSIVIFGPWMAPINAFIFIGLDFALRDWLHIRLKFWQMGILIASTGALTFIINPESGQIAIASAVAFTIASLVDWSTFARLRGSWMFRANGSNVAGAAVDSLIFPTIAFGMLMPQIVIMQFVAKIAGGAIWAWLLNRK